MRQRVYLQQQGHSEVRLFRLGEWIESDLGGRKFQFRLRPCQTPRGQKLLLRFRDSSVCQQALLRLEGQDILFKSSFTVAAQRYEPRRTSIEAFGVREGDLLLGSDVWSVDLLVSERFARSLAAILRWEADGLHAVACPGSSLCTLAETEDAQPAAGPLRLLAQEPRRDGFSTLFFVDDVLFELSSSQLGDERAHLRLCAIGYLLPPDSSRLTLGPSEECLVRLYSNFRARPSEAMPSWNLWFEAVRCRTASGTVVSAVTAEPGEQSGTEAFLSLLESYLPLPSPAAKEPSSGALADPGFVLQKAEEVLALAAPQASLDEPSRRLRTLLDQGNYHEASLLAEALRQQASLLAAPALLPLEHGHRFQALGTELSFFSRAELRRQRLPSVADAPGMLLLEKPRGLGGIELGPGSRFEELRIGRKSAEAPEAGKIDLPESNLAVSSQAARIFAEDGKLWVAPWRESLAEGDLVILNFQLPLEDPHDRAEIRPGDWLVLGNLILDLSPELEDGVAKLRLRGVLLDLANQEPEQLGSWLATALGMSGPEPRLRFQGGARLLDPTEADGSARLGPYRISCPAREVSPRLQVESGGEGLVRVGRSEGGMLAYSLRRRVTRLRQAPLYPVAPEIFVGVNWQAEQPGAGIEIEAPFTEPMYFRLFRQPDGIGCQASVEKTPGRGARHLRGGLPASEERLLPGDELLCGPVRLKISEATGAAGLELQVDLGGIELTGAQGGSVAGADAEIPEDEAWVLRLPHPFPRLSRLRWTSQGRFLLEGAKARPADALEAPEPRAMPRFSVFDRSGLPDAALRIGGPGATAELVHEWLPPGQVVGRVETRPEGVWLRPLEPGLWIRKGDQRDVLPAEGQLLESGDCFGWEEAEISYDGTWG